MFKLLLVAALVAMTYASCAKDYAAVIKISVSCITAAGPDMMKQCPCIKAAVMGVEGLSGCSDAEKTSIAAVIASYNASGLLESCNITLLTNATCATKYTAIVRSRSTCVAIAGPDPDELCTCIDISVRSVNGLSGCSTEDQDTIDGFLAGYNTAGTIGLCMMASSTSSSYVQTSCAKEYSEVVKTAVTCITAAGADMMKQCPCIKAVVMGVEGLSGCSDAEKTSIAAFIASFNASGMLESCNITLSTAAATTDTPLQCTTQRAEIVTAAVTCAIDAGADERASCSCTESIVTGVEGLSGCPTEQQAALDALLAGYDTTGVLDQCNITLATTIYSSSGAAAAAGAAAAVAVATICML